MELTEEQRAKTDPVLLTISDALNAKRRGDFDTYCELLRTVPTPASVLMAMKYCGYDDIIRKYDLDTSLADEKYGPGWLDRED